MVAISRAPGQFLGNKQMTSAIQGLAQKTPSSTIEKQAIIASKLKTLEPDALNQLQKSFFETAKPAGKATSASLLPAFAAMSPRAALLAQYGLDPAGFSLANPKTSTCADTQENNPSSKPLEAQKEKRGQPIKARTYGAQSKTPGLFSNPIADKAADAARQSQMQTQKFLSNQLGHSFAEGNMVDFLGPNTCFEDVLATVMMGIAEKSEREMMDQIRMVERGENGLNGFVANRAKDLGGIAGGALGGYFGGVGGAAIGQDVGERLVGNYTSQYGGSSRQIQFEKLKMMIHKQSEMMSAISNILATIHSTNKNAISNMRG